MKLHVQNYRNKGFMQRTASRTEWRYFTHVVVSWPFVLWKQLVYACLVFNAASAYRSHYWDNSGLWCKKQKWPAPLLLLKQWRKFVMHRKAFGQITAMSWLFRKNCKLVKYTFFTNAPRKTIRGAFGNLAVNWPLSSDKRQFSRSFDPCTNWWSIMQKLIEKRCDIVWNSV